MEADEIGVVQAIAFLHHLHFSFDELRVVELCLHFRKTKQRQRTVRTKLVTVPSILKVRWLMLTLLSCLMATISHTPPPSLSPITTVCFRCLLFVSVFFLA